jgi:hypothetical protein
MSTIHRSAEGGRAARQRYDSLPGRRPVPHAPRTLPDTTTLAGILRVYAVDAPGEPGRTGEARPPLGGRVRRVPPLGRPGTAPAMVAKGGPAGPERREVGECTLATFEHFKPRPERIPEFSVERLRGLVMPVQAHFGARDVRFDQRGAAAKLREALPDADVRPAEDAGHLLPGWAEAVAEFPGGRP